MSITKDEFSCFDSFFSNETNETNDNTEEVHPEITTQVEEEDILSNYRCLDCNELTLYEQDNDLWCQNCGTRQPKKLSTDAEYRFYGYSDTRSSNPQRVGMPTNNLLPETSMGSLIQHRSYDNTAMKRMVQYNSWNQMPYRERSLYKTCVKISSKTSRAGLPTIIQERAKELYNIVKEVNISRGINREGLVAACVWFACRDTNVPRSNKEIADMFGIQLQDMTRGIKFFRENWRLAQGSKKMKNDQINNDSSNPINYIERYCSPLPISSEVKHLAEFISVKAIEENLVDDNTAPSIAAGAIYLACCITSHNISKSQVAKSCKTSEVTISKCHKKLNDEKKRRKLLPKCYLDKL